MSAARKSFKLPEPTDIHRDHVEQLLRELGHDPSTVLRVRIAARQVEVDLVPPRRDVTKLTVVHQVLGPDLEDES